jgi:outer membrane lipoprotein
MIKAFTLLFTTVLITACASQPSFKDEGIDHTLTPTMAKQDRISSGDKVIWGGTILSSQNLKDKTRLEILSYPVDKKGRIDKDAEPGGRFYAIYDNYLETAEYRKNRWVSLTGKFAGKEAGKVGEADYTFPVVNISQLHLWPVESTNQRSPNVQFGIGVLFH